ncbi:hypothetical protein [Chryseobacterium vrystaatense]|uniref:Uncharacterized protein n=1 Tax=Chryseobacterium vrystaatense TaxID=307480 RepID=A0A1M4ZMF3_9FLAO|nr:hypothetical protein [Chryseobacterium vrystaatense]SHF19229.1 hypothetical protein SAMN02787073_1644 [Chryseobacterium vrystaatense]
MEIEGTVLKVKKRYTRIRLNDNAKMDLMYRKSDNYIVNHLKKGDWMKAIVKVKSYTIGKRKLMAFHLHIVKD